MGWLSRGREERLRRTSDCHFHQYLAILKCLYCQVDLTRLRRMQSILRIRLLMLKANTSLPIELILQLPTSLLYLLPSSSFSWRVHDNLVSRWMRIMLHINTFKKGDALNFIPFGSGSSSGVKEWSKPRRIIRDVEDLGDVGLFWNTGMSLAHTKTLVCFVAKASGLTGRQRDHFPRGTACLVREVERKKKGKGKQTEVTSWHNCGNWPVEQFNNQSPPFL